MDDKFWKTTIRVVVLSKGEEPYEPETIGDLAYDITDGDNSGEWEITENVELTPKEMADALKAQGSDPEFLYLDEEGNRIDKEEEEGDDDDEPDE